MYWGVGVWVCIGVYRHMQGHIVLSALGSGLFVQGLVYTASGLRVWVPS